MKLQSDGQFRSGCLSEKVNLFSNTVMVLVQSRDSTVLK